ncbi:MAG: hypothetical protein HBSAPP03_25520 [Phycisphaerae bacterium]|jgi:hypothetical protein|nr:MAG: hypothetical protein HBSAPP03_25520 [Phycisphaerae bacterium]
MRNFIALKIDLDSNYVALSATSLVATFTLMVPSSSSQDATVQGTDGKELAIAPGSQFAFERVDLSQIKVKSKPGECVYVIGHSG